MMISGTPRLWLNIGGALVYANYLPIRALLSKHDNHDAVLVDGSGPTVSDAGSLHQYSTDEEPWTVFASIRPVTAQTAE